MEVKRLVHSTWWGKRSHRLYTVAVFIMLSSLDNAAIGITPPIYAILSRAFAVEESLIGVVTASGILIRSVSALVWGYRGDQGNRKRILLFGTLTWSISIWLMGSANDFMQFILLQVIASIGLGSISSVGFSVVTDMAPPSRRGIAMSFYGQAQGLGMALGAILGASFGAYNWRSPYHIIGIAGIIVAGLYLLAYEPARGVQEAELSKIFASGRKYSYTIQLSDVRSLFRKASNIWLVMAYAMLTFANGAHLWIPRLFIARIETAGYGLQTSTIVGNLFAAVFALGSNVAIVAGYMGDVWQQRDMRGRALLSAIGSLGALPFFIALYFIPLGHLALVDDGTFLTTVSSGFESLLGNRSVSLAFLLSIVAIGLNVIALPNWAALVSDVNLPEHRGTVFGFSEMVGGAFGAIGNGLAAVVFFSLESSLASPLNYAAGLAILQLSSVPMFVSFIRACKPVPLDIVAVRETLTQRASDKVYN